MVEFCKIGQKICFFESKSMKRETGEESVLRFIEALGLQGLKRLASHLPPPNSDALKGLERVHPLCHTASTFRHHNATIPRIKE